MDDTCSRAHELYWITLIVVGSQVILNLITAVIYSRFRNESKKRAREEAIRARKDRERQQVEQERAAAIQIRKRFHSCMRGFCFDSIPLTIGSFRLFCVCVFLCLTLPCLCLCVPDIIVLNFVRKYIYQYKQRKQHQQRQNHTSMSVHHDAAASSSSASLVPSLPGAISSCGTDEIRSAAVSPVAAGRSAASVAAAAPSSSAPLSSHVDDESKQQHSSASAAPTEVPVPGKFGTAAAGEDDDFFVMLHGRRIPRYELTHFQRTVFLPCRDFIASDLFSVYSLFFFVEFFFSRCCFGPISIHFIRAYCSLLAGRCYVSDRIPHDSSVPELQWRSFFPLNVYLCGVNHPRHSISG